MLFRSHAVQATAPDPLPSAYAYVNTGEDAPQGYILRLGDPHNRLELVDPAVPFILRAGYRIPTAANGRRTAFANWLAVSRLSAKDMVLVFSVGGGDVARQVSVSIVRALELARERGATIAGIVGRDGGYTAKVADACVIVPTVNPETVTAHTEAFQAVIWHLLVAHPAVQQSRMKWESVQ